MNHIVLLGDSIFDNAAYVAGGPDVVRQLRDIAAQENINAEEDALAVLAEAGDGSMRDALSIMDQAIACCGIFENSTAKLTAQQVRGLMGRVSSDVLVQAMDCVQRSSSEDLLKLLDRLMTEGQSPSHFAKQLVRFLRNALVAKVAGSDSPLLQISADERQKVASTAALFSEEDLTRFLNIILRTHDELGYRQEQRFHLELGMLKMVHANRLLPIEELLTQQASSGTAAPTTPAALASSKAGEARPALTGGLNSPAPSPFAPAGSGRSSSQPSRVSPFEADRLRKVRSSEPEMSASSLAADSAETNLKPNVGVNSPQLSTATAIAVAEIADMPGSTETKDVSLDKLRSALIAFLEAQNQATAGDLLARGEWSLVGSQINLRLALSERVIELSVSAEARRLLVQEASRICGRMIKLNISCGGTAQSAPVERAGNGSGNGSGGARQRAAEDPVVKRMQEKFGAEVRTVVDLRHKK